MPWAASIWASSSRSPLSEVIPWAAAPLMKDSAAGPRAQNAFSAGVLGRTARVGMRPGPAIVLVENGRLTRGDEVVGRR